MAHLSWLVVAVSVCVYRTRSRATRVMELTSSLLLSSMTSIRSASTVLTWYSTSRYSHLHSLSVYYIPLDCYLTCEMLTYSLLYIVIQNVANIFV